LELKNSDVPCIWNLRIDCHHLRQVDLWKCSIDRDLCKWLWVEYINAPSFLACFGRLRSARNLAVTCSIVTLLHNQEYEHLFITFWRYFTGSEVQLCSEREKYYRGSLKINSNVTSRYDTYSVQLAAIIIFFFLISTFFVWFMWQTNQILSAFELHIKSLHFHFLFFLLMAFWWEKVYIMIVIIIIIRDNIWAERLSETERGKNMSKLSCAVLCTASLWSHKHTCMSSSYRLIMASRFSILGILHAFLNYG